MIDCFSVNWSEFALTYAFPPFSLIGQTLQKICQECSRANIIVPHWPSQPWFSILHRMIHADPFHIPVNSHTLYLPHDRSKTHPMTGQLTLWACLVTNNICWDLGIQIRPRTLWSQHIETAHVKNMPRTYHSGSQLILPKWPSILCKTCVLKDSWATMQSTPCVRHSHQWSNLLMACPLAFIRK